MPLESIDETLRTEFARIYKGEASPEVETETNGAADQGAETETSTEEASPVAPETDSRTRDESGKFTKQAKEPVATGASPQASASPKEEAPVTAPAPEPVVTERVRDINLPPSSWKPTAKAVWEKLPPEIRTEVHRRESDFLKGQSNLLPDAHLGQSMRQIIDPYRMLIDSEGGTPEKAVGSLLQTAALLRMGTPQQKQQLLVQMAQQYGIALPNRNNGQVQDGTQQAQPQPQSDPRIDQLFQYLQTQEQQKQARSQRELEGVAELWINERDTGGKPLRPYLDDVMAGMNVRVPQIRQLDPSLSHKEVLQKAYEQEIWANPEIRAILQKEYQDQLEAKSRTENQERVNLAKKAQSVNVPRRGSTLTPAKPVSIDETIRTEARRLGLTQ